MKRQYAGVGLICLIVAGIAIGRIAHTNHTRTNLIKKPGYVALGDSVAAGVGLKDASDSSACNRTNQAYPHLLARQRKYQLTNIACSGATLPAGILGTQDVNQLLVAPQLQQLFALPKPALISITIGANDAGWTDILTKCYTSECGSDADTVIVTARLATVTTDLRSTLSRIQAHYAGSPPRVIVTGYHQVFPQTDPVHCTDLTGIDVGELAWGRQLQTNITSAVQQVTTGYSFVRFTPIDFTGHELCTADPWVQGLLDPQPYHPTAAGQAQFTRDITRTILAGKQP